MTVLDDSRSSAVLLDGIQFQRSCTEEEKQILLETFATCKSLIKDKEGDSSVASKEISWFNLYSEGEYHPFIDQIPTFPAFKKLVMQLIEENYAPDDPRYILSYGYITGPKNGEKSQTWHHDYCKGVSNIFIQLQQDTTNNATQFIRRPDRGQPKSFNVDDYENNYGNGNYYPPPHEMLDREGVTHLEVTQIIARPFSVVKLMPNVIHRGIANKEDYDRNMFFISTSRTDKIPYLGEGTVVFKEGGEVL